MVVADHDVQGLGDKLASSCTRRRGSRAQTRMLYVYQLHVPTPTFTAVLTTHFIVAANHSELSALLRQEHDYNAFKLDFATFKVSVTLRCLCADGSIDATVSV
jgi:hypothetical protein